MDDWLHAGSAKTFLETPLRYPTLVAEYVLERLIKLNPCRNEDRFDLLLDAGCGFGRYIEDYISNFRNAIGFDISEALIEKAKASNTAGNINFIVGSENSMPAQNNSVDLLIASGVLHYMDLSIFLGECKRVLKSTGLCALYSHAFQDLAVCLPSNGSETGENLTPCSAVLRDYTNALFQHFKDISHPCQHWAQKYSQLYENISGFEKEKVDNGITFTCYWTLKQFKSYCLAVPTFRKHHELFDEKTAPLNIMAEKLKSVVQVDGLNNDDKILLKVTFSIFFIFLHNKI